MCRRISHENQKLKPYFLCERSSKKDWIFVDDTNPLNGIFKQQFDQNNVTLTPSSYHYGNVNNIYIDDDSQFHTVNTPFSYIQASLNNNKSFYITKYMIKGNTRPGNDYHLKSWKFEGRKKSDGSWVEIDSHQNEPFSRSQIRVFDVDKDEIFDMVKLTQTDVNTSGNDQLIIKSFDIFGYLSQ